MHLDIQSLRSILSPQRMHRSRMRILVNRFSKAKSWDSFKPETAVELVSNSAAATATSQQRTALWTRLQASMFWTHLTIATTWDLAQMYKVPTVSKCLKINLLKKTGYHKDLRQKQARLVLKMRVTNTWQILRNIEASRIKREWCQAEGNTSLIQRCSRIAMPTRLRI